MGIFDIAMSFLALLAFALISSIVVGYLYCKRLGRNDSELDETRKQFLEKRARKPHPYDYIIPKPIEPGRKYNGNINEYKKKARS